MIRVTKIGMTVLAAFALLITTFVVGCTTGTPLKTDASTSGIRAAQEVGSANVPQAALHLQLAKEELAKAKQLAADDEKQKAASMLTRAEADAELAVLLSRGDAERQEAEAAVTRVRELRKDNP